MSGEESVGMGENYSVQVAENRWVVLSQCNERMLLDHSPRAFERGHDGGSGLEVGWPGVSKGALDRFVTESFLDGEGVLAFGEQHFGQRVFQHMAVPV